MKKAVEKVIRIVKDIVHRVFGVFDFIGSLIGIRPEKLYASDYDESDLHQYAEKIINWLKADHEVWVFFNNDFNGFAVKNALKLNELVHSLQ